MANSSHPATTPTKHIKPQARSAARNDLDRIESTGNPWWTQAPSVAMACFSVAMAPFRFLALAADTAVSLSFIAVFGAVGLWYTGYIPDQTVADILGNLGGRLLAILEGSGLL